MAVLTTSAYGVDLSCPLDDSEHPEHKIYRKSAIRLSILKRIGLILSEEQRRNQKYPLHKQGSKSMGEKIANPDYVDPQKLLAGSRHCSQLNLSVGSGGKNNNDSDIMDEPELLDLSINEKSIFLHSFPKRPAEDEYGYAFEGLAKSVFCGQGCQVSTSRQKRLVKKSSET
ncbi:hypothetical protein NQ317_009419 [Molorchus minor]|uniref:Uncharacterized protein n=1 Tax=Molorchus minor TaxID=1323400 RepID=A0ABQ9J9I9_9CUCU|nr:hypothetical protein NQ317_009419 [Molorchus minor]